MAEKGKLNTNVLYLSYDGLTDPLGESQILPYVIGLSNYGYNMHIVSFEKQVGNPSIDKIKRDLLSQGIQWTYFKYHKRPPVLSTIYDVFLLYRFVKKITFGRQYIIHCRSYITALVGLLMKRKLGHGFIFDMRGFWADERVDGKIWSLNNPMIGLVFRFFKRKEKEFIRHADRVLTLTYKSKEIIHSWGLKSPEKIDVIPTCVDRDHFNKQKILQSEIARLQNNYGIESNDFVLGYVGSLGTWYMLEEMLQFWWVLKSKAPGAKFLIVTKDDPEIIRIKCAELNVSVNDIIITPASRSDIPALIYLCNWSIFFIQPYFSKAASAPTKLAEIINMGVPVLCNKGVGDINYFFNKYDLGYAIRKLDNDQFIDAAEHILNNQNKRVNNDIIVEEFDLKLAVVKLNTIYSELRSSF